MCLELIRKIRDDMYVDDLVTGGESLQEGVCVWGGRGGGGLNFTNDTQVNQI